MIYLKMIVKFTGTMIYNLCIKNALNVKEINLEL